MAHRFTASIAIAALALLNVAMPEPIVLDLLGTGLASTASASSTKASPKPLDAGAGPLSRERNAAVIKPA